MSKLFPNLVSAVVMGLADVFRDGRHVDRVVAFHLKNNFQWGSRDRSFVAETTYDMVRSWRLLWAILGEEESCKTEALYRLIAVYMTTKGNELPDWPQFKGLDLELIKNKATNEYERAVRYSLNNELDKIGFEQLGERWEKELIAMNHQAPVFIRVNTLKTTTANLTADLAGADIPTEKVKSLQDGLKLLTKTNVYTHPLFLKGLFEIQDAGSQTIAPFVDAHPGMRVIDACAGAGGKTLHLAACMQNKGRIIALDTDERKLEELSRRSRKNGVSIIEVRKIDNSKVIKRLHQQADRVLLDVPCSGTGVLRRNPDAKYKLFQKNIADLVATQQQIIQQYASMVKPGGEMAYATCSILPIENRKQVDIFLRANKEFTFAEEKIVLPSQNDSDGFYMAKLKRK